MININNLWALNSIKMACQVKFQSSKIIINKKKIKMKLIKLILIII